MAEIPNIDEQLYLELEPEDLTQLKNILNTKEPIESARATNSTEIKDLIPETEEFPTFDEGIVEGEALKDVNGLLPIVGTYSPSTSLLWPKYPDRPLFNLIEGTSRSDLLFDTPNNDLILAKGGNDYVIAWRGGSDLIYGEDGNDFIYAGDGNDRTYGGSGNDYMYGGTGDDYMYGDSNYYKPYFNLGTTNSDPLSLNSKASDISQPYSGNSSSLIFPDPYPYPYPPSGNDYLNGGSGNDYMDGGGGDDYMYGGTGDDYMYGDSNYYKPYFNLGTTNSDPLSLNSTTSDISQPYSGDSSSRIFPYLDFSPPSGNDYLNGGSGDDYMYGGGGDDSIHGGSGTDRIFGGIGNDYMDGGSGDDSMNGGGGDDSINGGSGDDRISGSDSIIDFRVLPLDLISVGSNQDLLLESSPVLANSSVDTITGLAENTAITDMAVKPNSLTIESDFFRRFPIISRDKDILTGGQGADKFVFYSPYGGIDTITDFNVSQGDQVEVSSFGFGGSLSKGQLEADQFTLGVSARDANDRFIYNAQTGDLFFDIDGVGGLEQVQFAQLSGSPSLTSSEIFVI